MTAFELLHSWWHRHWIELWEPENFRARIVLAMSLVQIGGVPPLLAIVLTPNLPEAAALLGEAVAALDSVAAMACAARALFKLAGPASAVLLKGGHLDGTHDAVDVLYGGEGEAYELRAPRVVTSSQ